MPQQPRHQQEVGNAQRTGAGVHQTKHSIGGLKYTADQERVSAQHAGEGQIDGEVQRCQRQHWRIAEQQAPAQLQLVEQRGRWLLCRLVGHVLPALRGRGKGQRCQRQQHQFGGVERQ